MSEKTVVGVDPAKEGSKIVNINEARADSVVKSDNQFTRDYEGKTVVVDWFNGILHVNGKPNLRFIEEVQELVNNGTAEVLIGMTSENTLGLHSVEEKCKSLFLKKIPITILPEAQELWSTKAVQFDDKGSRLDGANLNGAQITVNLNYTAEGLEVGMNPPKITNATEQVASMGAFLYGAFQRAMTAMNSAGEDKLTIAEYKQKNTSGGVEAK